CIDLSEAPDFAWRYAFEDVHGLEMVGMSQSRRARQLAQRSERALVKSVHACGLVFDHEGSLAPRILRRNPGGATVRMTGLRLDTAQRKHETARCIAPIGPKRQQTRDIKGGYHPPAGPQSNGLPQSRSHQTIVREHQTFSQRRADVIHEFEPRCSGATVRAIDDNEIRMDSSLQHGFADRHKLPGVPDAELEADRLAARQMVDLRLLCLRGKPAGAERAILTAAAEIAATDLPDQVAA